jgi:CHAT domain
MLTIEELKDVLSTAIARNLHLAIVNSCDGLGLARHLADLHLPQMIVMRELVPDRAAQEFLQSFLRYYSNGKSLYVSVRQARKHLQSIESDFPSASWLPVIWQNPAELPLTWEKLSNSRN